jgi:hypothetical protein
MDKPKLYTIKQGRKNPKRSTLVALDTKHQEALDRAVLAASTNTQAMRATNDRLTVATWSVEPLQAELAELGFMEEELAARLDAIGAHGDTDPDGDHC